MKGLWLPHCYGRIERLLMWLEGEDLFHRSSSLERSLTMAILGILVASTGFTALHSCAVRDTCTAERARSQALALEVERLRHELVTTSAHSVLAVDSAEEDLRQRTFQSPAFHLRGANEGGLADGE
ncbi:unnamed protein product [Symbiodinium natans]|uniref:Uncharacterized protein n=1 Tax=Symbiodinium natans TaxID=878477 RepID=A0A812TJI1_9DINO|nr:unnamed protein product [Symbiodinium natans]